MTDQWRMALMFKARGGDIDTLETRLVRASEVIRSWAGLAEVRLGVVDRAPELAARLETENGADLVTTVDGAVEVTVNAARMVELPLIAKSVSGIVEPMAAPGSIEVMAGPVYSMVPARDGQTFLSLAFKRDPATTSAQFQSWWRDQHAGVAIPVLGPTLLAYDQVHVDQAVTEALAGAVGVRFVAYDAYDNLTWADYKGFLASISDPEGMTRVYADEVGRIDNSARRSAIMRKIG